MYIIPREIIEKQSIIYFLKYEWKIVYIWESWIWIQRCFQHIWKKIFDSIEITEADKNNKVRKNDEYELINKYTPKYNNQLLSKSNNLRADWYINTDRIREYLREQLWYNSYKYTNKLKVTLKKYCKYILNWKSIYIKRYEVEKLFKDKFNIKIKL